MAEDKKPFKKLTYKLAITAKCRVCSCGSPKEVKNCPVKTCPLYPFRMGKQPETPVNALDLRVFQDVEDSYIFRVRKSKDENDDGVSLINKEYPAYLEDDEDFEGED